MLAQTSLTAAQVSMLTDWVQGGGNLIAMRPDKQLAGLLGLGADAGDASERLPQGRHRLAARAPASPAQTMQFHGTADRYALGRRDGGRDAVLGRDHRDRESRP